MSATVMKIYYTKQKPSIVRYCKFKNFCNDSFIKDIVKKSFRSLEPKKAAQKDDIKTNLLKKNVDFLQSTHMTISMIQFVLQNFPTN